MPCLHQQKQYYLKKKLKKTSLLDQKKQVTLHPTSNLSQIISLGLKQLSYQSLENVDFTL